MPSTTRRRRWSQVYYTRTGRGRYTLFPFGDHASYLNLMQAAFNTAGQRAWWGIDAKVSSSDFGVPALTGAAVCAAGPDRINSGAGQPIADRNETNVWLDWSAPKGSLLDG